MSLLRPKSLAEVADESVSYSGFGYHLRDFLHEFDAARLQGKLLLPMLQEEPIWLASLFPEGNICDAFLAGTADYLARVSRVLTPQWALAENRVLEKPWFSASNLEARALLLRDTPSAFKEKNIFVFADALSVA